MKKFKAVFNASADLLMIVRKHDGAILDVNNGWRQIITCSPQDLIGKTIHEVGFFEDKATLWSMVNALSATGRVENVELPILCSSGEHFIGLANVIEINYQNQSDVLLSIHDITESKLIERLLSFIAGLAWSRTNVQPIGELLVFVSELIGADYMVVSQVEPVKNVANTQSFVKKGRIADNFSYALDGTPCHDVYGGEICIINQNLQQKFPRDLGLVKMGAESYIGVPIVDTNNQHIGIVAAIHTHSFKKPLMVSKILQIASKPIANEMERLIEVEHLKTQEDKYKQLFESLELGMALHEIILDDEGKPCDYRYVDMNAAFEKYVGLPRLKVIGMTVLELWPETETYWIDLFGKVALNRQTAYFDDYSRSFGHYYKGLAFSPSENHFVVVFQDVTDHKIQEQQLIEREDQLNKIFENTQSALMLVNENADIVQINPAGTALANKSQLVQVDGQRLGNVLKCINSFEAVGGCGCGIACKECKLRQLIVNTFFKMNGTSKHEVMFQQATGQGVENLYFLVSTSLVYLRGAKHVLITLEDVTSMKLMELELVESRNKAQESDRLKTAFFNNLSHEIRTPLNGIVGFANLLKKGEISRDETNVYVGLINENSSRLLQIMNNVIELSQLTSGNFRVSHRVVDLKNLTEKCIAQSGDLFSRSSVDFDWCIAGPQKINSDYSALQGVLGQLLANAFKFTAKGRVRLKWYVGKTEVTCLVADSGIGIDRKDQEAIFTPFKQVEDGLTRSFGGVGIGLAIANSYATALEGVLDVRSELGKGSVFRLSFPLN